MKDSSQLLRLNEVYLLFNIAKKYRNNKIIVDSKMIDDPKDFITDKNAIKSAEVLYSGEKQGYLNIITFRGEFNERSKREYSNKWKAFSEREKSRIQKE